MTKVEVEVRPLGSSDTDALSRFFCANDKEATRAVFHPFPLNDESARRISQHEGRDLYYAAFRGAEVIGFGMLRGWDEGFAVPSFGVLVDHRERGRGLGRQLTEHALSLCGEKLRLTVAATNTKARSLYEQLGFISTETLPDGRLVMHWERTTK